MDFDSLARSFWQEQMNCSNKKCGDGSVQINVANEMWRNEGSLVWYLCTQVSIPELGRFPINNNVRDFMLKYCIRLISHPSSRLVSHCYWSLYDRRDRSDSWLEWIKSIIYSIGPCYIWNNQKEIGVSGQFNLSIHQAYLSQNLKDRAFQQLFEKLQCQSKLHLFKTTKETLCLSNHIS